MEVHPNHQHVSAVTKVVLLIGQAVGPFLSMQKIVTYPIDDERHSFVPDRLVWPGIWM